MLKIHALAFLIAIIPAKINFCQQKSPSEEKSFYIRTNPFSFLEIDGGMMIGARYQWTKKFSATLDPTFIFFSPYYNSTNDISSPLGIKIRADFRYHFKGRGFVAPELHYKYRTKERQATFGFNCFSSNCAYYMEAVYKEIKTEVGGSIKAGFDTPIGSKERLALEVYGGLGLKIFKYKEESIPPGGTFSSEPSHQDFFGTSDGAATPILFGSMKLSYRLW